MRDVLDGSKHQIARLLCIRLALEMLPHMGFVLRAALGQDLHLLLAAAHDDPRHYLDEGPGHKTAYILT